jgi:flavodoxin
MGRDIYYTVQIIPKVTKLSDTMKTCVIYYSRTGNTAMVARTLAEELDADLIEIRDLEDRKGFMSSFRSSIDAIRESKTPIKPEKVDLSGYDLIYVGTPTWAGKPAPAIITLIDRADFLRKDVILFTTMSRQGGEGAIDRMSEKIGNRSDVREDRGAWRKDHKFLHPENSR